jgi:predicted nucleotidyltransferase
MPDLGMLMPNMGTKRPVRGTTSSAARAASLADALFTGTQQRVLGLLFGQPARSYYATELISLAGGGSGAVQRELARLARSGLVTVRPVGNQKHYQANPDSPLFTELCGILQKTVGLAEPLRDALQPLAAQIRAAFVFGSVAKRQDVAASDIDLMVVSDALNYGDLFAAVEAAGARLGRAVNPTILSGKDLAKRVKDDNAFVTRVLAQPKIWLIGGEDDLRV